MRPAITRLPVVIPIVVSLWTMTGCTDSGGGKASGPEKAAQYTKRTGHKVFCNAMVYTEGGKVKHYRTIGDYRRMGSGGEMGSDDPDSMEICWACADSATGKNIPGLCLTTRELESMGRLPKQSP